MTEDIKNDEERQEEEQQASSADPVLSDEEKDALLEGIQRGDVQVHSSKGPVYAEVRDFVISPRAHIITNSFPRLDLLNGQMANLLSKSAEKLLGTKVKVFAGNIVQSDFGTLLEKEPTTFLINAFEAPPLEGPALICIGAEFVSQLVECFFGGNNSRATSSRGDFFTPGEKGVVGKFSEAILESTGEAWEAMAAIKPAATALHLSTDLIDGIDPSTEIICCTFDLNIGDVDHQFRVVWPESTVKSLLPALRDQKREKDPVQDATWNSVIRSKVTDSIVRISSQIGQTRMILRDVAALSAGDIIEIDNPRRTVILAKEVPVLEGLFGVHNGQYAIEATRWLAAPDDINSH